MLEAARQKYQPPLPEILKDLSSIHLSPSRQPSVKKEIEPLFPLTSGKPVVQGERKSSRTSKPLRIGAVFSGGPAAGGHNVVAGLFDALQKLHPQNRLFGFLDGPAGILDGKFKELTRESLLLYRNQGGFDLLGSGRTKIVKPEDLQKAKNTAMQLQLDGLVIIGGDDSNTTAAILAEYFLSEKCPTRVIGVPKTIDGDLQNEEVSISFGFDTACKVYSELIGNIARDALSSKKYFHFIRLMGRAASQITLECALSTRPNLTLIGEERKPFDQIIREISNLMAKRIEQGKNYGIILIPEGLFEFLPEKNTFFADMPKDSYGNVNLSSIETDLFLVEAVKKEYKGKFSAMRHFFGYEGRCALPSNFDANYALALGYSAAILLDQGYTGYMCFVGKLTESPAEWTIGGVPLTSLLHLEQRDGKEKPVIAKALVDLKSKPYRTFKQESPKWALSDAYVFPGPTQFFGDSELTNSIPHILR